VKAAKLRQTNVVKVKRRIQTDVVRTRTRSLPNVAKPINAVKVIKKIQIYLLRKPCILNKSYSLSRSRLKKKRMSLAHGNQLQNQD